MTKFPGLVLLVLFSGLLCAQQSSSFRISDHAVNAAGHPAQGVVLSSAHFRVTLDALGESVGPLESRSASYGVQGGFVGSYPPPGEVAGLEFMDAEVLIWQPERTVGNYNLYRDLVGDLPGDYGTCLLYDITGESATDDDDLEIGQAYFYLVTAKNLLDEEGPKGYDSNDLVRPNPAACP